MAQLSHLTDAQRDELFDLLIDTTDPATIRAWFADHPGKPGGN